MNDGGVLARFGEIFGGVFSGLADQPLVRLGLTAMAGYVVLLWLASAWWAFQDLRRRHADPTAPYLAGGLVVLASPLLFPLALLVYGIVRPARTLAERHLLDLEDTLVEAEANLGTCPRCRRPVEESWLACPACRTRLAYRCLDCDRAIGLDWDLCAWCGGEFGGRRAVPGQVVAARRRRASWRRAPATAAARTASVAPALVRRPVERTFDRPVRVER